MASLCACVIAMLIAVRLDPINGGGPLLNDACSPEAEPCDIDARLICRTRGGHDSQATQYSYFACFCAHDHQPNGDGTCYHPSVHVGDGYGAICERVGYTGCAHTFKCTVDLTCGCGDVATDRDKKRQICIRKKHGDSCTLGKAECEADLECKGTPPTCSCPGSTLNWNDILKECQRSYKGKECTNDLHCHTGVCTNAPDGCACAAGKEWDDEIKQCHGKYNGFECQADSECHTFMKCVDEPSKKVCRCGDVKPHWSEKFKRCLPKKEGDKCMTSKECEHILTCKMPPSADHMQCKCSDSAPNWDGKEFCLMEPALGEKCEKGCRGEDFMCKENMCVCALEIEEPFKGKCVKKARNDFGGECKASADCITERKLECDDGKCKCTKGLVWIDQICQTREDLKQCSPTDVDTGCRDGKVCLLDSSGRRHYCTCSEGLEFAPSAQMCKLKAGENCFINGAPQHEMCASQHCVTDAASGSLHKCACTDKDGFKQVWSPLTKACVTNFHKLPCNYKNQHVNCRPAGAEYDATNGLRCLEGNETWTCECLPQQEYFLGNCVSATLSYDDVCDPNGKDATCKIGAPSLLACKQEGDSGPFKCGCQMADVSDRVPPSDPPKLTFAQLVWVNDRCDFVPPGDPCAEDIDCKSVTCNNDKKCAAIPADGKIPPKTGGAWIRTGADLILVCTVSLLAIFA